MVTIFSNLTVQIPPEGPNHKDYRGVISSTVFQTELLLPYVLTTSFRFFFISVKFSTNVDVELSTNPPPQQKMKKYKRTKVI